MRGGGLARDAVPEFVVFCKRSFDVVSGKQSMNVGLVASVVAGVGGDALSEQFLDGRDERVVGGELEAAICEVGSLEASSQWRDVE